MDCDRVWEVLWSVEQREALLSVLLDQFRQEAEQNGMAQIEEDNITGWERLSALLHGKQADMLEELDVLCSDEAMIALRIAFERGQYAGFQHFFQRDTEPLTFEGFVLDKILTVPEMQQFPDYYEAKMKVNKLETELADQLDPFSREHLTSITSAWEERSLAMLRYGFALGHQAAVDVIESAAPEQAARMIESEWKVAKDTGTAGSWH